jgi:hypothetical protein
METKDTCLYIHTRKSDGGIFYVGIGNKKRPYDKIKRNRFWKSIVKKYDYDITILKTTMSWEEACELEIKMIAFYGRKDVGLGCLVNMTDGGDGSKGCIPNTETRKKLSQKTKGKNNPNFNKITSDETKKKISEKCKNPSEEIRKKMSGENHSRSKKVICDITGKIYMCVREAAENNGINYGTLKHYLRGDCFNKTSLRYL